MQEPEPIPLNLSARERARLSRDARKEVADKRKESALFEARNSRILISEFIGACLETLPWVGAFVKTGAFVRGRIKEGKANALQTDWLREHDESLSELSRDVAQCRRLLAAYLKQSRKGGNKP